MFDGGVMSVIKAIRTGLINPKPIPPITFAITYIPKLKDNAAINIAIPNMIKPAINTGILPLISEIAPEKS